ncbi:host specificity protein J [Pararobbsia silviterrae]|uniref:Host specificity protein J n=1 Tax=Pararobbsia silviterrae TaxID=1792498 RepID=A0A494X2D6_9BURK|nr:phage tail protein [Pararobbsia silviterrae]RKP43791.1 host specificity protein J [Pararobbsia silviterrae]
MNLGQPRRIRGAKDSGASQTTPTESPDTLHSTSTAKILDLVSEGEVAGLANGLQSVYFDGTPLMNADGSYNFTGVTVDVRTGTQNQDYISGFPSVENGQSVGVELRADTPWTHAMQNLQLSAVRIGIAVEELEQTNTSTGDVTGYRVAYQISLSTDGGPFNVVVDTAFDGKTTSEYVRTHRIDLPAAESGWVVRVTRTTPNSTSSYVSDTTTIDSVTEVIDAKLRYPMRAVIGTQFDAKQFSSIPARSFDLKGRIISVPSNYDPDTRAYTGTWDGTFKPAWSDCPPWVLYDMLVNDLYGLGDVIDPATIDRYQLYTIAQYCDELVADGLGGQEPRFTCNAYIQTRADALQLLQSIASIFCGVSYWASNNVVTVTDMPRDPVYTYTAANVVDGTFSYVGSSLNTRYTVALVSWNDPANQYQQAVEYVPDDDGIERYGIVQTEISAFGCTSQGQAQRLGRWTLLSSRLEGEVGEISVGLDGVLAMPGQVVEFADPVRAGRRNGGRILAVEGTTITLDKATVVNPGDTFTANLPTGVSERQTVQSVDGRKVTLTAAFSVSPEPQAVWSVASDELGLPQYTVRSVTEQDGIVMKISATRFEPQKFSAIDSGTRIDARPITVVPPSVQPPPTNVRLSSYSVIDQGIARTVMTIAWDAASSAVSYLPEWQKDGGDWVTASSTGALSVDVPSIYQGTYLARVRSVNALQVTSTYAYSTDTVLNGKTSPPPALTSLTASSKVFGIDITWGFPDGAADTQRTELWRASANDQTAAVKVSDLAYPQSDYSMDGLAAGTAFFFWARLVDTSGNIGPWYPSDPNGGVIGQASDDATPILDYLEGQITQTQLAEALLAQIDSGGGAAVLVQQLTTALAAMYTIKTQLTAGGRTVVAGIGVGVENDDGVTESQVLIEADRFAVIESDSADGTTVSTPFVIQGGQVFLSQAFIGKASITSEQIGDYIQSDDFVSGVSGWRIEKTGAFEINGVLGGGRVTLNQTGLFVYNETGVLMVEVGKLS